MLGTAVIAGMSMVTALGIFFVPALFVVVGKLTGGKKGGAQPAAAARTRRRGDRRRQG